MYFLDGQSGDGNGLVVGAGSQAEADKLDIPGGTMLLTSSKAITAFILLASTCTSACPSGRPPVLVATLLTFRTIVKPVNTDHCHNGCYEFLLGYRPLLLDWCVAQTSASIKRALPVRSMHARRPTS